MKRTLTCESCNSRLTLVILKKDEENLVLPIANGDSYDYFIVGRGGNDISWFGYINEHPEY